MNKRTTTFDLLSCKQQFIMNDQLGFSIPNLDKDQFYI